MCFPGVLRSSLCQCGWQNPTCCWGGGHDVPCSMCALNAVIPTPHCSPQPINGQMLMCKKKFSRKGVTPWPPLVWPYGWCGGGKLHCHGTLALTPPSAPRHSPSLPYSPGRQQDGLGREADSSYCCQGTQPIPKGQQQPWAHCGHGRAAAACTGTMRPPLFLLGTARFLTQAGEKEICLNKPRQTKSLKLFFSHSLLPIT